LGGITFTIDACDPVAAYKSERVNFLGNGAGGSPRTANHSWASNSENSGNSRLVKQRPWRTMAASWHNTFKAVGLPEAPRIFVPHPIQDATDDEIRDKTDVIIDRVDRGVDELNCHRVGESAIRPAFISERLIASGS
jgi:hypothetical protein